jgi:hypothetical protein
MDRSALTVRVRNCPRAQSPDIISIRRDADCETAHAPARARRYPCCSVLAPACPLAFSLLSRSYLYLIYSTYSLFFFFFFLDPILSHLLFPSTLYTATRQSFSLKRLTARVSIPLALRTSDTNASHGRRHCSSEASHCSVTPKLVLFLVRLRRSLLTSTIRIQPSPRRHQSQGCSAQAKPGWVGSHRLLSRHRHQGQHRAGNEYLTSCLSCLKR